MRDVVLAISASCWLSFVDWAIVMQKPPQDFAMSTQRRRKAFPVRFPPLLHPAKPLQLDNMMAECIDDIVNVPNLSNLRNLVPQLISS